MGQHAWKTHKAHYKPSHINRELSHRTSWFYPVTQMHTGTYRYLPCYLSQHEMVIYMENTRVFSWCKKMWILCSVLHDLSPKEKGTNYWFGLPLSSQVAVQSVVWNIVIWFSQRGRAWWSEQRAEKSPFLWWSSLHPRPDGPLHWMDVLWKSSLSIPKEIARNSPC